MQPPTGQSEAALHDPSAKCPASANVVQEDNLEVEAAGTPALLHLVPGGQEAYDNGKLLPVERNVKKRRLARISTA
jgi:hypothetical protein